ncbi:hypothetical protein V8F06_007936 [Rhypophila decipiens]
MATVNRRTKRTCQILFLLLMSYPLVHRFTLIHSSGDERRPVTSDGPKERRNARDWGSRDCASAPNSVPDYGPSMRNGRRKRGSDFIGTRLKPRRGKCQKQSLIMARVQ